MIRPNINKSLPPTRETIKRNISHKHTHTHMYGSRKPKHMNKQQSHRAFLPESLRYFISLGFSSLMLQSLAKDICVHIQMPNAIKHSIHFRFDFHLTCTSHHIRRLSSHKFIITCIWLCTLSFIYLLHKIFINSNTQKYYTRLLELELKNAAHPQ